MHYLVWYDDNPTREFDEKVAQACAAFYKKHHVYPNVCKVHPSALDGVVKQVGAVHVEGMLNALCHHFWIGKDDDLRRAKSQQP